MGLSSRGTTSDRHEAAKNDPTKLTAGELAKQMRAAGMQVKAQELSPHATEWHHAGFHGNSAMGKCYFFKQQTHEEQRALYLQILADREAAGRERFAWKAEFETRRGTYGKKTYRPVSCVLAFAPGAIIPAKWEQITIEDYQKLLPHNGASLVAYESLETFKKRI